MSWFLYLIECADDSVYTGITTDVAARFDEHASGKGARYTRSRKPRAVLASFPLPDRSSASRAEYWVKRLTAAQKRELAAGGRTLASVLPDGISSDGGAEARVASGGAKNANESEVSAGDARKSRAKSGVRRGAKSDAKPDAKPQAKSDAKPGVKSGRRPGARPAAKPQANSDAKLRAKSDEKSGARSGAKPDAKPAAKDAATPPVTAAPRRATAAKRAPSAAPRPPGARGKPHTKQNRAAS
ncbi:GIY-YIG nuclease family protein [Burkholderia vietnamiensis]|jgi:putative endonuclease|uniref:GIY-YIG nuclease family protein n=1 Tax=Burkholderia vietnamiensis TaxID=60552 RepID=UPI0010417256|nr:GIY-YIG nuclease family protein [Burkholderia vietnamiensis]MBR8283556.1 GIY-YIG nuclease family protein [Burkholderia vietnamiensis]MCA8197738.1 GIY-YIG nuclease family protein [Burkholderia vietnamiensis]MDN7411308.1 GIY-YIG nuclease family protein [Burkholderia vietnamiensis]QTK83925.1 GIY-YIG nuclease family protein [Burkholderia vietnamiensis]WHU92457.1 GIY-YIG nuclease family protein [Burkholderia vietnamiensis]